MTYYIQVLKNNWKGEMSGLKEKFSKILVAIDGSQPSMDAVDYAIAIPQRNEAELTALYVVSSPTTFDYTSDTPEDQIPEIAKDIVHSAKKESESWFNEITEKVKTRAAAVTLKEDTNGVIQLKTQVVVSPLSVTGSIVQYAECENIDLIVVGTRGRSGFKRLLLGSTASGIVTHAHCPVMVVR
jgi:nucleotide-binding universal stress UspA family protein